MRFLSHDPVTGISRWVEYDPATGDLIEKAEKDCTASVEMSKSLQNDGDHWKQGVKNGMAHYAFIDNFLLEKWANEGVDINDNQALFEMVNKPEYAYLRTTTAHESGR
jgi:hypothetical protein